MSLGDIHHCPRCGKPDAEGMYRHVCPFDRDNAEQQANLCTLWFMLFSAACIGLALWLVFK